MFEILLKIYSLIGWALMVLILLSTDRIDLERWSPRLHKRIGKIGDHWATPWIMLTYVIVLHVNIWFI